MIRERQFARVRLENTHAPAWRFTPIAIIEELASARNRKIRDDGELSAID